MFPEGIVATAGNIRQGCTPCMCSSRKRFSEATWLAYLRNYSGLDHLSFSKVYDKKGYMYVKGHCNVCKDIPHLPYEFDCSLTTLDKGHIPCGCAKSFQWTKEQQEIRIKSRCKELGVIFIGFKEGYKNNYSKVIVEFSEGHLQYPRIANLMHRDYKDNRKSVHGFNPNKPAHFYIVRWHDDKVSYLKFGITNQETIQRIKQQSRKAKLDYTILHEFYHEDGSVAYDCEKYLMSVMETGVCTKELLPDGYTETTHDTQQNIDLILSQVNKFGLKSK